MGEIGSGNNSVYPGDLDTNSIPEVNSPAAGKTKARKEVVEDLTAAVIAIETELGTDPAGSLINVKTYLQTDHQTDGTHKSDHGPHRWIDAGDYANFQDAINAAIGKTLVIATSVSLPAGAITIPATVLGVMPLAPGVINKGSATSLTINGPVVGNPMHQWLSGFAAGDIRLNNSPEAWGEWVGMKNDGWAASPTDNSVALLLWLSLGRDNPTAGLIATKPRLRLGSGRFNWSTPITYYDGVVEGLQGLNIEGVTPAHFRSGDNYTRLHYTGTGYGLVFGTQNDTDWTLSNPVYCVHIKNIRFSGTTSCTGVLKAYWAESIVEDCSCKDFQGSGAVAINTWGISNRIYHLHAVNCITVIEHVGHDNIIDGGQFHTVTTGIRDRHSQQLRITNNLFQTVTSYAILADGSKTEASEYQDALTIRDNFFSDCQSTSGEAIIKTTAQSIGYAMQNTIIEKNEFYPPTNNGANLIEINYPRNIDAMNNSWIGWSGWTGERLKIVGPGDGTLIPPNHAVDLIEHLTADRTLKYQDHGKVFTNKGAAGIITVTLPRPAIGLKYTFVRYAAFDIILDPVGAAANGLINGAATYTLSAAGESVTIEALGYIGIADEWWIIAKNP